MPTPACWRAWLTSARNWASSEELLWGEAPVPPPSVELELPGLDPTDAEAVPPDPAETLEPVPPDVALEGAVAGGVN